MFPMTIKKMSGRADSSSGGKDYHLVLITTSDDRGMLICRWGKATLWGTGWNVDRYEGKNNAINAFQLKYRQKIGKNYDQILIDTSVTANDENELKAALGPQYWNKLGAENCQWLVPGADTTGVTKAESVEFEASGTQWRRREKPPMPLPPEAQPSKEELEAQRIRENPNWGAF